MTKAIAVAFLLGTSLCLFGQSIETKKTIATAEKGDPEAQDRLATIYRGGIGLKQDKSEAVGWYRRAAQQGYAPAIYSLATCYYNGEGVTPDDVQAYAYSSQRAAVAKKPLTPFVVVKTSYLLRKSQPERFSQRGFLLLASRCLQMERPRSLFSTIFQKLVIGSCS